MPSFLTKKEAQEMALGRVLAEADPFVREALMAPFGAKVAWDDNEGESWISAFRGTPLHTQAVDLQSQRLQLRTQEEQMREQERAGDDAQRQQRDQISSQRRNLDLQREMLQLELERLQGAPAPAPVEVDPAGAQAMEAMGAKQAQHDYLRMKLAAGGGAYACHKSEEDKTAAPLGILGRGKSFVNAARQFGLSPEVKAQLATAGERAVAGGVLGAAGGYLTKDENEGGLGAALKGGLGGAALGAGTSVLGAAGGAYDRYKALRTADPKMTGLKAVTDASKTLLDPRGAAQMSQEIAAARAPGLAKVTARPGLARPVDGAAVSQMRLVAPGTPRPPAAVADPFPAAAPMPAVPTPAAAAALPVAAAPAPAPMPTVPAPAAAAAPARGTYVRTVSNENRMAPQPINNEQMTQAKSNLASLAAQAPTVERAMLSTGYRPGAEGLL